MQKRILGVVANNNTKRCVADRYTEIQENDQGIHELRDCGMSTHELRDSGKSTHEIHNGTLFLARHPTTLKWTQTRGASFTIDNSLSI